MTQTQTTLKEGFRTINLTLCLQAPVLSQSAGARSHGLDAAMWYHDEKPALPGSLVKGNIRHTLERFNLMLGNKRLATDIANWFGMPSGEIDVNDKSNDSAKAFAPQAGKAIFDYAWLYQPKNADNNSAGKHGRKSEDRHQAVRTRIKIDALTGAVEHGSLQTIDSPFAVGEEVQFKGRIFIRCEEIDAQRLERCLTIALQYLPAIGALKGAGFGKVIGSKCTVCLEPAPKDYRHFLTSGANLFDVTKRYQLQLTLDRPFCISARPLSATNRFETLDFIPGNVLKGAMATAFKNSNKKHTGFDLLHVSHAYPRQAINEGVNDHENTYPFSEVVVPKSVVVIGNNVFDLALLSGHQPGKAFLITGVAPKFETDWKEKDRERVNEKLSSTIADTVKTLSLHTRIKSNKNYAEKNGLFSQEEVLPHNKSGPLVWCATVHIPATHYAEIDPAVQSELWEWYTNIKTEGILNIGRTRARAQAVIVPYENSTPPKATENEHRNGFAADENDARLYVITLQSNALLLPKTLTANSENALIKATNDGASLRQLYANYWRVQHSGLELVSYFATQRQMGGTYYHAYYRRQSESEKGYRTDWLTEAGSVFVLKVKESDSNAIAELTAKWLDEGLPLHSDYSGCTWKDIPYIPENGYGAVLINHTCHEQLAPPPEKVTVFQEA